MVKTNKVAKPLGQNQHSLVQKNAEFDAHLTQLLPNHLDRMPTQKIVSHGRPRFLIFINDKINALTNFFRAKFLTIGIPLRTFSIFVSNNLFIERRF